MKKIIILFILFLLLTPILTHATDYVPCDAGKCNGWDVTQEKIDDYLIVKFENNTGKTAFDLMCKIVLYDFNGQIITSIYHKPNIPIRKQTGFKFKPPANMLKMSVEIYYKDEY